MSKQKITKEEYYSVVGLLHMAHDLDKDIKNIEKALATILEEPPDPAETTYYGHISDAVYESDTTVDDLLRRLKIQKPKLK